MYPRPLTRVLLIIFKVAIKVDLLMFYDVKHSYMSISLIIVDPYELPPLNINTKSSGSMQYILKGF